MNIDTCITEINEKEGINVLKIIKTFEKKLLRCFKLYEEKSGFEDYRMNDIDILILHTLWKNCDISFNIEEFLIIIYGYFKLEEIYFPTTLFSVNDTLFKRLFDSNVYELVGIFKKI